MRTDTPMLLQLLDETRMPCRISDGPQEPEDAAIPDASMDEPEDFDEQREHARRDELIALMVKL